MVSWNYRLYRYLHRIVCTICGHPLFRDGHYGDSYECGCGKMRR